MRIGDGPPIPVEQSRGAAKEFRRSVEELIESQDGRSGGAVDEAGDSVGELLDGILDEGEGVVPAKKSTEEQKAPRKVGEVAAKALPDNKKVASTKPEKSRQKRKLYSDTALFYKSGLGVVYEKNSELKTLLSPKKLEETVEAFLAAKRNPKYKGAVIIGGFKVTEEKFLELLSNHENEAQESASGHESKNDSSRKANPKDQSAILQGAFKAQVDSYKGMNPSDAESKRKEARAKALSSKRINNTIKKLYGADLEDPEVILGKSKLNRLNKLRKFIPLLVEAEEARDLARVGEGLLSSQVPAPLERIFPGYARDPKKAVSKDWLRDYAIASFLVSFDKIHDLLGEEGEVRFKIRQAALDFEKSVNMLYAIEEYVQDQGLSLNQPSGEDVSN